MNNSDLVNHWLLHQKRERGRSTGTLYSYSMDSKRLLGHLSDRSLRSVSTDELRGWVHAPLTKGERMGTAPSASTLKRRVSMLRSLFRFLHAEGLVSSNPAERLVAPTVHNEMPKPVSHDDWVTLYGTEMDPYDRVAFGLAFFCGLRRQEVVSLTPGHFEGDKIVDFRRKGGKLGSIPWLSCVRFFAHNAPALVGGSIDSFVDPLRMALSSRDRTSPIVPWKDESRTTCPPKYATSTVDPQQFNRHLERSLVGAGLAKNCFTPHQLRHGFCTFLLNNGVPLLEVSRLAGHSNVTITQRYIATQEDPLAALLGAAAPTASDVAVFGRVG